jgi:ABC-2 type transport system permease protein
MTGTVFDIGYQRYSGDREGRRRGRLAIFKDGLRIALGFGRGGRAKILPWAFVAIFSLIGLIMALISGAANKFGGEGAAAEMNLPSHGDYYAIVAIIVFVFAAVVAPELLCSDRREGTINLYLVRPVTGTDYVVARWLSFLAVMLFTLWLPQLLLFLGLSMGSPEPVQYLREHWLDIPRFLLAGAVMSVYATTLAMLTASFTKRRAYASVFLVGLFFISMPFTLGLAEELGGTAGAWISMFSLLNIPLHVIDMIFGELSELTEEAPARLFSDASLLWWYLLWIVLPGVVLWWRYRRLSA